MNLKKFFKKDINSSENKENNPINFLTNNKELKNWKDDKFQSAIVQRNLLLIGLLLCFILILIALSTIRYLKNTQSIDPFVIEIEKKSGVPTVVKPLSIETYSANESIKRYFIMKYIRAREEYFSETFNRNFNDVVRVLSNSTVYYGDYRNKFGYNNPSSPYNLYGTGSYRTIGLKSIIFPSNTSAQIRINLTVSGQINMTMNKIIYMEFDYFNLNMNEQDRLINPLGFQVTLFRMNDENS